MQSRNRFLNEYESSCIINLLLELNSPGVCMVPGSGKSELRRAGLSAAASL